MNIYPYFNSKDVAEYLEKIDFHLTAVEMARIIEYCDHINLEEKHEAFRLLIKEFPDAMITILGTSEKKEEEILLSTFLNDYIATENKLTQAFDVKEENCIYSCTASDIKNPPVDFLIDYTTWEGIQKEQKELIGVHPYVFLSKFNFVTKETTWLCFDKSEKIVSVENRSLRKFYSPLSFVHTERKIPLPFEKGDLVCDVGDASDPIVFLDAGIDTIFGYTLINGCFGKAECFTLPIELEYYREEPKGLDRVLKIASDFERGKIELSEFANQYHKILLEGYVEKEEKQQNP